MVAGEADPTTLADLARGRLRAKRELLTRAIVGRFTAHHAILITEHLSQFDYPKEVMERVSAEIAQRLQAEHEAIDLIDTVPGIG
jgi:transposase